MELYLTEIIRSGTLMFVVCLIGVWQHNFEPVVCVCVCVCVYGTTGCRSNLALDTSLGEDGRSVSCCQVAILCVIPRDYFEENIYRKVSFIVTEK